MRSQADKAALHVMIAAGTGKVSRSQMGKVLSLWRCQSHPEGTTEVSNDELGLLYDETGSKWTIGKDGMKFPHVVQLLNKYLRQSLQPGDENGSSARV